jgi:hypothetical protein
MTNITIVIGFTRLWRIYFPGIFHRTKPDPAGSMFDKKKKEFQLQEDIMEVKTDLAEKIVPVTGSTDGLGRLVAKEGNNCYPADFPLLPGGGMERFMQEIELKYAID